MTEAPTPAEAEALARALEQPEVIIWPGQPFTLETVRPWLVRNDALRKRAAKMLRTIPCAPDPRIAALEAERDRLREALWQIIDGATEYTRTECAIARAALAEEKRE